MRSTMNSVAKPELAEVNPLVAGAAASVLVLTLVGAGAVTGVLPNALLKDQSNLRQIREAAAAAEYRPIAGGCAICGTVDSIRTVRVTATGLDPAAGELTGGVLGHPSGTGNGDPAMTILGAAGGAFGGNAVERNGKRENAYRVTIRMDDGSFRTVSVPSAPTFSVGDKVRVVESRLVRA